MKTTLLIASFLCLFVGVQAQNDPLYLGYLRANTTLLKSAVADLEKEGNNDVKLLEGYYLLLNNTMRDKDEDTFDEYVDKAVDTAERILKKDKKHVKANAMLGAIYGLKIAYSPMKGMFLGGKSSSLSAAGISNAPDNPVGHFFFALNKYNTPETWGGDKALARKHFQK
ncbi:MAG: hypothetical protein AAF740_12480, partial [Bacteroidota bacterium]